MSHVPSNSTGEQPANVARTDGAGRGSRSRSLDAIFELLADQRRREALYVLCRREGPITVPELADEVASAVEIAPERAATVLHHVHLPKLADVGVVDYDVGERTVRLADCSTRFRRYLHIAAKDEDRFVAVEGEAVEAGDEKVGDEILGDETVGDDAAGTDGWGAPQSEP